MKAILLFLMSLSYSFSATAEELGMTTSDKASSDALYGIALGLILYWVVPK